MKTLKIFLGTSLFILASLFYGCEKNTYFQLESSVKKKIEKRWQLVRVAENEPVEDWVFSKGKVYRISGITNDTVDIGDYAVKTTLLDAFVTISNFKEVVYHLNTKYTIEELDDKILVIFGNDEVNGGGTIYKEFTVKK